MGEFPNAVCLGINIAERIADVARADHVFILVDAFVGKRKNNADCESRQMTLHFENEVLRFPETSEETHENFSGVFGVVAC